MSKTTLLLFLNFFQRDCFYQNVVISLEKHCLFKKTKLLAHAQLCLKCLNCVYSLIWYYLKNVSYSIRKMLKRISFFWNSTKDRKTHFNISVAENAPEIIMFSAFHMEELNFHTEELKFLFDLCSPITEYETPAWDTNNKNVILKVESVQRKAARFFFNSYDRDSSVSKLIKKLNLDSIELRSKVKKLKLMLSIASQKNFLIKCHKTN